MPQDYEVGGTNEALITLGGQAGPPPAPKPPGPPVGWDKTSVGAHPGAQIHHDGNVHNPRATMTIEMPPTGAQVKQVGPPAAPGAEIRKDTVERT
jgi:hypothetical protein